MPATPTTAEQLVHDILVWWAKAQFWSYNNRNVFDDTPDFVKTAQALSGLTDEQIRRL